MNGYEFTLAGARLLALPTGALWWAEHRMLVVSDLHLGKSERIARRGGAMLPPYETRDTLHRLEVDVRRTEPAALVCLGDSFDDLEAARGLSEDDYLWLTRLQAGRQWIWIEGNHDPEATDLGGTHLAEMHNPPLFLRHIANSAQSGEISGHYHPKAAVSARGRSITRPCFLVDADRVILPAYGTFTGGLRSHAPALTRIMRPEALAVLTGPVTQVIPMPR